MFAICTTVLVAVHIFALMISTYILPNIEAIAKLEMYELISESPHERMKNFIEIAWAFSTVLGSILILTIRYLRYERKKLIYRASCWH